jgi:hypothetical protein
VNKEATGGEADAIGSLTRLAFTSGLLSDIMFGVFQG